MVPNGKLPESFTHIFNMDLKHGWTITALSHINKYKILTYWYIYIQMITIVLGHLSGIGHCLNAFMSQQSIPGFNLFP
jgi:hypothetical protein